MSKGEIRPACIAKFRELLPQRAELGNTEFRRAVMNSMMETFRCSLAAAATHYNHAFHTVKVANPELVVGLGRPEDKKGGRKKKIRDYEEPKPQWPWLSPYLALTYSPSISLDAVLARPAPLLFVPTSAVAVADELDPMPEQQTVFTVLKKSNSEVVAEGLSLEDARELCAKAKATKKAALYWL